MLFSLRLSFLLSPCALFSMLIGNPAAPALYTTGIFTKPTAWCTIRTTFLEDFVYSQRYQDEFKVPGCDDTETFSTLSTNAGMLTINFKDRIDFYGILGASRLQLNRELYSKMQLSWGGGGKVIMLRTDDLFIGLDIKYFASNQAPLFFSCEGLPFNIVHQFEFQYREVQGSFGLCFRAEHIAPYIYATYLIAKIEPQPAIALVRWPLSNILVDVGCKSAVTQRCFGLAVGATLTAAGRASVTLESRMLNQNAIDVNLEVRF